MVTFSSLIINGLHSKTRLNQIRIMKKITYLLTGQDNYFDPAIFQSKETPRQLQELLQGEGLKVSVQAEYFRVLIRLLVKNNLVNFSTLQYYRQVYNHLVSKISPTRQFKYEYCRQLTNDLIIIKNYRGWSTNYRVIGLLLLYLTPRLLNSLKLQDLLNTRVIVKPGQTTTTGSYHQIDAVNHQWIRPDGSTYPINSKIGDWLIEHGYDQNRLLLLRSNGRKYQSISVFSRFLKTHTNLAFHWIKKCQQV